MEDEPPKRQLVRYMWPRGDKSYLFRIQMVISAIIIFTGIIQATNIYLLQKAQANSITLGFFVTVILIATLNIITIIWAVYTNRLLSMSDDYQTATNTQFSKFLLFLTLVFLTIYIVFFIIFSFATEDLFNQAMVKIILKLYQKPLNTQMKTLQVLQKNHQQSTKLNLSEFYQIHSRCNTFQHQGSKRLNFI